MKVLIYKSGPDQYTETFIKASVHKTPFDTVFMGGDIVCSIEGWNMAFENRFKTILHRVISKFGDKWEKKFRDFILINLIKRIRPDVVLAQFGPSGVEISNAIKSTGIPMVVYFRGYDATKEVILKRYNNLYLQMFDVAKAIICVSRTIRNSVVQLGAKPDFSFVNPSGADMKCFENKLVDKNQFKVLTAGRFVEKKAPHLMILAFYKVLRKVPQAQLVMVGDGVLLDSCKDLVEALGIKHKVDFKGSMDHTCVLNEMLESSVFVQHSIKAQDGDSEGTPVAVMEASAIGLPIVATRHAGIQDVVINNVTGFLTDEKDINSMAENIVSLLNNKTMADNMGLAGRQRIKKHFSHDVCFDRLETILRWVVNNGSPKPILIPDWN